MKYLSTRKNNEYISFKEAVINGLTKNGGLYVPERIPEIPSDFFEQIESYEDLDIAFTVLKPFVEGSLNDEQLKSILAETLNFNIPVVPVEKNIAALELYHGPTQAFKDVGARFMSRCLSHFNADEDKEVTIIVATSGDTGSAVANGFFKVPGVAVKILFPKGKVSAYQEFQMTSLGENIHAFEIDGTFDDCQKLVKKALNDENLRTKKSLSSANSINVARLLPQMLYYFFAYKQLKKDLKGKKMVVSVPSGNLGNVTAGLVAKRMGLPIDKFIAAHNINDTFYTYLNTGEYAKKTSVLTYSNAMDVGDPSNYERIDYFYNGDLESIKKDVAACRIDDEATLKEIQECQESNNYTLDPHGAVGKLALSELLKDDEYGVFLETAHPQKFATVMKKALPDFVEETADLKDCHKTHLANNYEAFVKEIC
ncbi:MAG: threonine synthase [Flavobacteriales bacterium]|nr:threonine synthase [Flavobacteriales bacterium]